MCVYAHMLVRTNRCMYMYMCGLVFLCREKMLVVTDSWLPYEIGLNYPSCFGLVMVRVGVILG